MFLPAYILDDRLKKSFKKYKAFFSTMATFDEFFTVL